MLIEQMDDLVRHILALEARDGEDRDMLGHWKDGQRKDQSFPF
jgi:hypothetical protein